MWQWKPNLERNAVSHVKRINDIAKTLAHLSTMCITNDRVQVHVLTAESMSFLINEMCFILYLERQHASQLSAHHDHARHPEEDDVMS